MKSSLRAVFALFVLLPLLTGLVYPLAVTVLAQVAFPSQANGSLIRQHDKLIGSELIGQSFDDAKYFWGRPSATDVFPYNAASSTGSNLGPTNPDLLKAVKERIEKIRAAHPDETSPVPVELVTASASGLDPHISPAAAEYQVARVAKARGTSTKAIRQLVAQHTEERTLGVLGEPRVNVLRLNLALDAMQPDKK
jgi:K+-transporting ATPase ATPase C chain